MSALTATLTMKGIYLTTTRVIIVEYSINSIPSCCIQAMRKMGSIADRNKRMEKEIYPEYLQQDVLPTDSETRKREKALVRKLDTFIAPVMMMLMLISYLDRGNIGFAATQGMTADINLKGTQLNVSN